MKRNKSLSKQFLLLMGTFFTLFLIGISSLVGYEHYLTDSFREKNNELEYKEMLVRNIDDSFNSAILQSRGYFAFGNEMMLEDALEQEEIILEYIASLEEMLADGEEQIFPMNLTDFHQVFFGSYLPEATRYYQEGEVENLQSLVYDQGASQEIADFRTYLKEQRLAVDEQIEDNFNLLTSKLNTSQWLFVSYLLFILLVLFYMTVTMFKKVGKPLNELAVTAQKIASGKLVSLPEWNNREDEIGTLSSSFSQMVRSLQANEEEVVAQNEELLAQQDELQAQQDELQNNLTVMEERKNELEARNKFILDLTDTLDKQELLVSVVINMGNVFQANRGVIVLLDHSKLHASFGLTDKAVAQFKSHLANGFVQRARETTQSYSIKRICTPEEKLYHENDMYAYDLVAPIFSTNNEMIACMFFSRYNADFTSSDIETCDALSKQVNIALGKLLAYEESEHDRLLYQDILNSIHEGAQLVNRSGNILQVNTNMCELFDCPSFKKMIQAPFEEWMEKMIEKVEKHENLILYMRNVLKGQTEEGQTITYEIVDQEKRKVMKVYSEEVYRNNQHFGFIFIHRDITKEYEVDEMKSEFVSTVSHELRTPLASVLGFTELMLNKVLSEDRQKKYLTTIYQEAKRLTALINDFLDVQRMEAGKQTYEKKFENIVPILEDVIETQKGSTKKHELTLVLHTQKTTIIGDKAKITQVFNNIINNAIKYSPDGGRIEISVLDSEEKLIVDVKDEGIGIPAEAQKQLFTKFYRVDNSDMRQIGGTGLGLAIVKEIMKGHEGDVELFSKVKEGTTFRLIFPLATHHDEVPNSLSPTSLKDRHVVIIEDDKNLATLMEMELQDSGFAVKHFSSAIHALKEVERKKPDAIVLDIMLEEGKMDGWGFLEKVKSKPNLADIPIIISSALEEKEKGIKLGVKDYLVKPYQTSKLVNTILQTLLEQNQRGEILVPSEE
ncbi:ATP-binding protein [Sutcliffiella deserti]|uniref:ATP-binding protein n=1 Tax=Sutcliffiella deserti TaxID=2875501 RepID=UPI001CC1461B|nr:ATP-binding protein [Sutcliffiella deserti]